MLEGSPMSDISAARTAFIEKVGLIAQAEGMPRSAGRLFGLLLFDGTEHAFGRLAEELRISRGNVSASVRLLEERGLVARATKPGDRQDYFRLADDPFPTLLRGAQARTARAAAEIEKSLPDLPDEASEVRKRIEAYAGFYRAIVAGLDHALTRIDPSSDTSASVRPHRGGRDDG